MQRKRRLRKGRLSVSSGRRAQMVKELGIQAGNLQMCMGEGLD